MNVAETTAPAQTVSYFELARLFLRLSMVAFGGPIAHIAMVEDEVVTRRRWLTRDEFLDIVAATNLIPGPNSTEVMIHIGYRMRGIPGAVLTGACFIIPAMLITLALAVMYVATGNLPQAEAVLWGIQPVILAVIMVAAYRLFPSALINRALWALFAAALIVIAFVNVPEVIVMIGAGVIYAIARAGIPLYTTPVVVALPRLSPWMAQGTAAIEAARATAGDLFFYFLKIGSVLFGSGYILIAYIEQDIVSGFGWMTTRQLLDAVAIGQFTPGPVLTTTTTVGYIVAGWGGALAATLGVFLPSFVLVILTAPLIPRMRASKFLGAFLSGVNAGVIAAILVTVLRLAGEALHPLNAAALPINGVSAVSLALFAAALYALVRLRVNATWLVLGGGAFGLLIGALG